MRGLTLCFVVAVIAACGGNPPKTNAVSREPVSVRGWIDDVEGSPRAPNPEMETARRTQLFQATSIWVQGADYVSGGVAENGAFILLDVPPGNVTIAFNTPGAEDAKLILANIPGNADVFVPAVVLRKNGASVVKPQDLRVRVPAQIAKAVPAGKTATVAGVPVPVMNAPLNAFVDRRDYPVPIGFRPVATFK